MYVPMTLNDLCRGEFPGKNTQGFVWMQFTGLKDKNGREIYEGDVVQYESDFRKITGAVGYDEASAAFKIAGNHFTWFNPEAAEIIGNIYENPELLQ